MLDMGVWNHFKTEDCPQDQRLVGCRWEFKVKHTGVYQATLVAKDFSQFPWLGVHRQLLPRGQ